MSLRFVLLATATGIATPALAATGNTASDTLAGVELGGEGPGDPIVVTGKRDGYGADRSASATKTDSDLNDVPQAVSIVTAEQISDQALRSIGDVVSYVPGISIESGEGHRDAIVIRGLSSTADFFTDGLRDDVQHYRGLYNVERVEVLKGPNALVFGRGGGGGVVNRVIKRPFHDEYVAGAVSIDSEGAGFAELDLNSPLSGNTEGRLNAVYERLDNFRDIEGDRFAVNPTLSLHLSPTTRLDLGYEYAQDNRDVDRGLPPAFEGTIANPATAIDGYDETFFGVRGQNRTDFHKHVADARLEAQLGSEVTFVSKALFGAYDKFYRNALPSSAVTEIDGVDSVKITAYEDFIQRENFLWQNDVVANVVTGGIGHRLLVGADMSLQSSDAGRLRGFFDGLPAADKSPNGRETFVPLAQDIVIPEITFRGGSGERASETEVEAFGIYVQDQVEIGEHVELIAGLRHDWVDIRVADFIGGTDLTRSDSLWSPRLGAVVKPNADLSVYASWSRSYLPQSGDQFASLSPTTAALEPERFSNYEVGAKWRVIPEFDVTLAAYRLDRTNMRAEDPTSGDSVLTGEIRAEGIELEVHGKVGRLSLAGGMAFQDAEVTSDTGDAPAGRQVADLPDFDASLWGRYDVTDRLGMGLGVSHRSSMFASFSNEVVVEALTLVDAGVFYDLSDDIALQVNVENLFDADGIVFAHNDNNLYPVEGRTARATLRFGF
ncbi:TonB-dependent receptor [Sphingomicrobium astaxanthinifaciens]|uniref:TonB-dependent receptor n=1 Tax=Sphingomicrobium astaxanthinifaciens TaxID=1227949 RepID=UPI001FCB5536|nr:TonB-dependent receptor [Sphingomicrobium astaxanthinifaciens]MCJ7421517.1 TonB-dependent receptor [Sphingomicrobium astaxanthinifaciens]